jgi:hypothetical protein
MLGYIAQTHWIRCDLFGYSSRMSTLRMGVYVKVSVSGVELPESI